MGNRLAQIATTRLRRGASGRRPEPLVTPLRIDPRTAAKVDVTPDTALGLTSAYAAINRISTDVAILSTKLYQRRESGLGRDEVRLHPGSTLLSASPGQDEESTPMAFKQAMIGHALGWGNGYAEIVYDGDGELAGLELMDPRSTRPIRRRPTPDSPRGELAYQHSRGVLPPYRVFPLGGLGFDGVTGYSPISLAKEAIALGLALETFGASFFGRGSHVNGVLQTAGVLDDAAITRMKQGWREIQGGLDNAHDIAVLEQGLEWKPIGIPNDHAQFLLSRQFQVIEIARIYNIPPHKIGDYSQSHLANIEAANLDYMMTTILPWCRRIEQWATLRLLTREERESGMYFEHDLRLFMRGDSTARANYYSSAVNNGWMSRDEVRDAENENPIGEDAGGGKFTAQTALTTLSRIGEVPAAPLSRP